MGKKRKKKTLLLISLIAIVAFVIFFSMNREASLVNGLEAKMWHSPTCGCCENYEPYLESKGVEVTSIEIENVDSIKDDLGVPQQLRSCHTIMLEGYIIEGHVPIEAIEKLLKERPNIKGIAVPGMPDEAPGMAIFPGKVTVYAFTEDGKVFTFY